MGYLTSWIGNTFSGNRKWVQINIEAMYVAPDGTVYTNSIWDEAAKEAGIYKNGDVAGFASNGSQADIMTPDPNVEPEAGWVDVPYGVRAYRRSNGEYIVFLEEDHHGKVLFFRWRP